MAVKKNDIALSFDKAEYYTLQEASEYLNRKHGIDNITPKKLLKQIYNRKINTYIHFTMKQHPKIRLNSDYYKSTIFNKDFYAYLKETKNFNSQNEFHEYLINLSEKLTDRISTGIFDDLYMGFILFKVSEYALLNMSLSTKNNCLSEAYFFDGFLHTKDLTTSPSNPITLKEWDIEIEGRTHYASDVTGFSFIIDNDDNNIKDTVKNFPFDCIFDERDKFSFIDFYLTLDDLIILHKDLEQLESQIIENAPIPEKEQIILTDIASFMSKRGVSRKKLEAKLIANAHAQHLWAKDHDKQIRISEMCENIWAYMIETDYKDQLPEKRENLKDWLINTPPHASNKGRPSNS